MPGEQPVFSQDEEELFVAHTIIMPTYGFPITTIDLRCIVKSYLDRIGRRVKCFPNTFLGQDWGDAFVRRHSVVLAANGEEVENLEHELDGLPAQNIWNIYQIRNSSKACTSLMVSDNVVGDAAPLFLNYKPDKLWTIWLENRPEGARYNMTESGWFDQ
ncbi:hypothetical protein PR048_025818 [Dryococelus australis]|uniref:Uncharacterized protein n=1 Tax=Dryococelus australis TaxID=614101 RepID=A0ABQ9GJK6_9NEOP|nr:hypothetical protein PR048_025818 [Dryococelus australis]